jgi:hypothetical protein
MPARWLPALAEPFYLTAFRKRLGTLPVIRLKALLKALSEVYPSNRATTEKLGVLLRRARSDRVVTTPNIH